MEYFLIGHSTLSWVPTNGKCIVSSCSFKLGFFITVGRTVNEWFIEEFENGREKKRL